MVGVAEYNYWSFPQSSLIVPGRVILISAKSTITGRVNLLSFGTVSVQVGS